MTTKLFVTGTDTDVGKTYISKGILQAFNNRNLKTLGLKPVASGCENRNGSLYNLDALALQHSSTVKLDYNIVNPFAFQPAIAPHIAAEKIQQELNIKLLNQSLANIDPNCADLLLIEGVGGWFVPLNKHETMADFVMCNNLKVILVVAMKLGCLNHALLTYKAMEQENISVIGWVANCMDPKMDVLQENILSLKQWLPIPCVGIVGYQENPAKAIEIGDFI